MGSPPFSTPFFSVDFVGNRVSNDRLQVKLPLKELRIDNLSLSFFLLYKYANMGITILKI
jgi:hypothetical protein